MNVPTHTTMLHAINCIHLLCDHPQSRNQNNTNSYLFLRTNHRYLPLNEKVIHRFIFFFAINMLTHFLVVYKMYLALNKKSAQKQKRLK